MRCRRSARAVLFNAVIGQSAAGAQQAFDALSGEVHAGVVTAGYEDALLPQNAILDRLNQPIAPPTLGAATEATAAYAADLPSRKGPALAPVAVQMYQPRMFDLWGQGFGDWGRVSSDGNAASLSRTIGGFVLGGDASATNLMGGDWRFGLAGGYTNDFITVSQRGSSGTFESVFGGAYAGASFSAFQLRVGALYGTNTTSTTRQVVFPGFSESLSSNNGGYTAQAFGEAGYRIQFAGLGLGGGSRVTFEPFAGAAAFVIHQNGFTEVGGTSALTGHRARLQRPDDHARRARRARLRLDAAHAEDHARLAPCLWGYGALGAPHLPGRRAGLQRLRRADRSRCLRGRGRHRIFAHLGAFGRRLILRPIRTTRHGQCVQGECELKVLSK